MEYRFLGESGFKVPVLSFGAGTFGGKGPIFGAWGNTDVVEEVGFNLSAYPEVCNWLGQFREQHGHNKMEQ